MAQFSRDLLLDNSAVQNLSVQSLVVRNLAVANIVGSPISRVVLLTQASATLTTSQVRSGALTVVDASPAVAPSYTLPAAATLIANLGLAVGDSFDLRLINDGTTSVTLVAGTGNTLLVSAPAVNPILTLTSVTIRVVVLSTSTVSYKVLP